jgi:hypothetical protein
MGTVVVTEVCLHCGQPKHLPYSSNHWMHSNAPYCRGAYHIFDPKGCKRCYESEEERARMEREQKRH